MVLPWSSLYVLVLPPPDIICYNNDMVLPFQICYNSDMVLFYFPDIICYE